MRKIRYGSKSKTQPYVGTAEVVFCSFAGGLKIETSTLHLLVWFDWISQELIQRSNSNQGKGKCFSSLMCIF